VSWLSKILGGGGSKRADLDAVEREELEEALGAEDLDATEAMYSVYRGQPFSETQTGLVVIGVAKPAIGGHHIGFSAEFAFGTIVQCKIGHARAAGRSKHYAATSKVSGVGIFAQFAADME
jgi:hypothetical protein